MSAPDLADLLRPGPPAFHLTAADPDDLSAATAALAQGHRSAAVRRIRGTRCRTPSGLFDELAAALQFPAYFGGNWNALRDMLADLRWLPAEAYVLVVEDADELLADTDGDTDGELLVRCLQVLGAAAAASTIAPFQIVLQAASELSARCRPTPCRSTSCRRADQCRLPEA